MAVSTAIFWISLVLTVVGSNGSGELSILNSPDSLKFSGSSKVPESILKEIFSASLGLSVEENSDWEGLRIKNPFNTPEAVVEVYIDGISSLGNAIPNVVRKFPLDVDEYEPDTFDAVQHRIRQRYTNGGSTFVNINVEAPNDFAKNIESVSLHNQILKHSVEEDNRFLKELSNLNAITKGIEEGSITPNNVVDIYNFRFRSLHALSDFHGPTSIQTKEAKRLLGEALEKLSEAFVKAYDGSVLVTVVTTNVAHTRRVRALRDDAEQPKDSYSADSAAIFNILLWFTVVFIFCLVAIVYTFVDMDPGRDSIIYRMTSTRMKKDN